MTQPLLWDRERDITCSTLYLRVNRIAFAADPNPQEPGAHACGTSSEEQVFLQLPDQRPQEVSRLRLRGLAAQREGIMREENNK